MADPIGDINFTRILERLREIHGEFPDLRFGEVLQKALDNASNRPNVDFHDLSSKKILTGLGTFRDHTKNVRQIAREKKARK